MAEELEHVPDVPGASQEVIRPVSGALYKEGHLAILRGNLAEGGAVAKISGLKSPVISGPARVFEDEQSAMEAILSDKIRPGDV
ncbi:dihydroxy-acid dehydratase, partial [Lysobacter sp. 2RAB21]